MPAPGSYLTADIAAPPTRPQGPALGRQAALTGLLPATPPAPPPSPGWARTEQTPGPGRRAPARSPPLGEPALRRLQRAALPAAPVLRAQPTLRSRLREQPPAPPLAGSRAWSKATGAPAGTQFRRSGAREVACGGRCRLRGGGASPEEAGPARGGGAGRGRGRRDLWSAGVPGLTGPRGLGVRACSVRTVALGAREPGRLSSSSRGASVAAAAAAGASALVSA